MQGKMVSQLASSRGFGRSPATSLARLRNIQVCQLVWFLIIKYQQVWFLIIKCQQVWFLIIKCQCVFVSSTETRESIGVFFFFFMEKLQHTLFLVHKTATIVLSGTQAPSLNTLGALVERNMIDVSCLQHLQETHGVSVCNAAAVVGCQLCPYRGDVGTDGRQTELVMVVLAFCLAFHHWHMLCRVCTTMYVLLCEYVLVCTLVIIPPYVFTTYECSYLPAPGFTELLVSRFVNCLSCQTRSI